MKRVILFAVLAFVLASCTSPLNKKYTPESALKDLEKLEKELSKEDYNTLGEAIVRAALEDKKIEGRTYADLLEEGRAWEKKQQQIEEEKKALAEKAKREEEERLQRLREAVSVVCFAKGFEEVDYDEYITYKFAIENKSDKAIRAVKGVVVFTNLFGDEISKISFVYDKKIKVGETAKWDATTEYNKYNASDVSLRSKDLDNLKVVWKPSNVLFDDGTSLE